MALQKQIVSVNLGFGGIDQKTDETRVTPDRLIEGKNLRFNKTGRLDKRNGTQAWANTSVTMSKLILNQQSDITAFSNEAVPKPYLFATGSGTCVSITSVGASVPAAYMAATSAGPAYPGKTPLAWCMAEQPNYRFVGSIIDNGTKYVWVTVYEKSSGKMIQNFNVGSGNGLSNLRIIGSPVNNDTAMVGFMQTSGAVASINLSTVSSTAANASSWMPSTNLGNPQWDWTAGNHASYTTGFLAITIFSSTTALRTSFGAFPNALGQGGSVTFNVIAPVNVNVTMACAVGMASYHNASRTDISTIRAGWSDTISLKFVNYSNTFTVLNSALTASFTGSIPKILTGVTGVNGTTKWFFDNPGASPYLSTINAVSYNGGGTNPMPQVYGMNLVSKACGYPNTNAAYFYGSYDYGLQKTNFLISSDEGNNVKYLGKIFYGVANGSLTPSLQSLPNLCSPGSDDKLFTVQPHLVKTFQVGTPVGLGNAQADYTTLSVVESDIKSNGWRSVQLRDEVLFTGGFLGRIIPSSAPQASSPQLFPEIISATSLTTATGSMTSGTYLVTACYETLDGSGRVNSSAPCAPVTVSITQNAISITTQVYRIIDGLQDAPTGFPRLAYYRTLNNQTDVFYRCGLGFDYIFADNVRNNSLTLSDAVVAQNEPLYIQGGEQPNFTPECPVAIASNGRRVLCVSGSNPNHIYQSKPIVFNEAVQFIEQYGGKDIPAYGPKIVALSNFFDKWIAFKETATFYATGDGVDATGANDTLSDFEVLSDNIGVYDPDSVVETNYGIVFKSRKGFYLLNRALQLSYIGAAVEEYNDINVVSASFDKDDKIVYFVLSTNETLVLTIYESEQGTQFFWTVDTNTPFTSEVVANGTKYSALNTTSITSSVFKTATYYTDDHTNTGVVRTATTGWMKTADLQGFQRVYNCLILGDANTSATTNQIQVDIAYDYQDTYAESKTISIANGTYNGTTLQWKVKPKRQKCEAIKFRITDLNPDSTSNWYLKQLQLVIGVKGPENKMSQLKGG